MSFAREANASSPKKVNAPRGLQKQTSANNSFAQNKRMDDSKVFISRKTAFDVASDGSCPSTVDRPVIDFAQLDALHAELANAAAGDGSQTEFTGKKGANDGVKTILDFSVEESVHLTLLARVVECLRFSLRHEILDEVVTLPTLLREFHLLMEKREEQKAKTHEVLDQHLQKNSSRKADACEVREARSAR